MTSPRASAPAISTSSTTAPASREWPGLASSTALVSRSIASSVSTIGLYQTRPLLALAYDMPLMQQREDCRHENQRRHRRAKQSSNYCAAQRRILLASLTQPQGHRHHTDHHCERGHQDGPEAGESGFDSRFHGIAMFGEPLLSERNDQYAICSGHAHAHYRSHERGNAQRRVGYE